MANDPLDTGTPTPAPAPAPGADPRRKCVCEFCGCQLTPGGEIIKMGERAKEYHNFDDRLEAKDKEIARLGQEITDLKRERDALKGSGSTATGRRVGCLVE